MGRTQLGRLLKERSLVLSLLTVAPVIAVILGLAACVKYPVGDSEKSKVDPQYAGVWTRQDEQDVEQLLFVRPYDPRTYLVSFYEYHVKSGAVEPDQQACYKAWLVSIGGSIFMTLEDLSHSHFAGIGDKPPYFVMKTSMNGGALRWQMVNGEYERVKNAGSSQELEEVIAKNIDAEKLLDKQVVLEWKKADDKKRIEAVLKAFHCED